MILCNLAVGGSIRDCGCRVEGGWAECPAEVRRRLAYERANKRHPLPLPGYTGDVCDICGSSQLIRNGTCLLCTSCGATSGCS